MMLQSAMHFRVARNQAEARFWKFVSRFARQVSALKTHAAPGSARAEAASVENHPST
jgi:hypothetical protein